jgi:hypothetical protein
VALCTSVTSTYNYYKSLPVNLPSSSLVLPLVAGRTSESGEGSESGSDLSSGSDSSVSSVSDSDASRLSSDSSADSFARRAPSKVEPLRPVLAGTAF